MRLSFTLLTVLAGLAIAHPAADGIVDTQPADGLIEARALDGECVRCVRRGCGNEAVKCLTRIIASKVRPIVSGLRVCLKTLAILAP
jgi:hypothetical protein